MNIRQPYYLPHGQGYLTKSRTSRRSAPPSRTATCSARSCRAALRDDAAEVLGAHAVADRLRRSPSIATGGLFRVHRAPRRTDRRRPALVGVREGAAPPAALAADRPDPAAAAAAEIKRALPLARGARHPRAGAARAAPRAAGPGGLPVADLGDDRLASGWRTSMSTTTPGRDETYARAAYLLARLAARRAPGTAAGTSDLPPGLAVRKVVESRGPAARRRCWLMTRVWARPLVATTVDPALRADLAPRAGPDARAARRDGHPAARAAARRRGPGEPAAAARRARTATSRSTGPSGCQLPLGHDLGQLLVGEVERGRDGPGAAAGPARRRAGAGVRRRARRGGPRRARATVATRAWCAARSARARCPARSRSSTSTSRRPPTASSSAGGPALARFVVDLVLETAPSPCPRRARGTGRGPPRSPPGTPRAPCGPRAGAAPRPWCRRGR